jgi:Beta/Gamma crystallin
MAHIILYIDANFGGLHTHVFDAVDNLQNIALGGVDSGIDGDWNDKVSSFVILEGNWQFFENWRFDTPLGIGNTLGPGFYPWIEDAGACGHRSNDRLTSLRPV